MVYFKKNKLLNISIFVSIISIIVTLLINRQLADAYLKSDGKTRALFGVIEILQFGYQYYVTLLGGVSLILLFFCIKGNNQKTKLIVALLLSLLAITIVFVRIWRLFI